MKYTITFEDNNFPTGTGGKAFRLAQLYKAGFNVPFGGIINYSAYKDFLNSNTELKEKINNLSDYQNSEQINKIIEAIEKADIPKHIENEIVAFFEEVKKKGFNKVAVRSSGSIEDGITYSFAGQFESYLNIDNPVELSKAVLKCWSSQFSDKVLAYCNNNQILSKDIEMNVVIQGQIDSEKSGVVFTANPLTGNDKEMVVEVVAGLGENLVQGIVNPESYAYNWYTYEIRKINNASAVVNTDSKLIEDDQIRTLSSVCLDIQQYYGEPLDIEWAYNNGTFFIVQARPLTSIHFDVDFEWTNADLKDGGISSSIATPLMYSLYEYIFENTMPEYFKTIGAPSRRKNIKWFNWWFGYSYWNMQAAKECVKKIPGFIERNFDLSLGIEPDYDGNGHVTKVTPVSILNGIRILISTKLSIARRSKKCKQAIENAKEVFSKIDSLDFNQLQLEDLADFAKTLIEKHYLMLEGGYFFTIYDNSNAATFCQEAVDKYNKKNKDNKIEYIKLICGLKNLAHLKPTIDLWELSRSIIGDRNACDFYSNISTEKLFDYFKSGEIFPFSNELKSLINKHRFHSIRELEINVPNWDEDPMQAFNILIDFVKTPETEDLRLSNQKQFEVYLNEKARVKSKSLQKNLKIHRHLLWWREEMRDYSTKMYYYIRFCLIKLADKMLEQGLISSRDDIFFLKFDEVFKLASGPDSKHYQILIEKNKQFHKSFANFNKPNEIWKKSGKKTRKIFKASSKDELTGISGSPGIYKGKAKVINTIFEANNLAEGEILVTKFTDPAWTPYFARIGGLVTETGGMLSHGAVVSREYGIPAVLGVNKATTIIKNNSIIEIDGHTGTVKVF
ncbi:MAG: hypothetical protein KGZ97_04000 [Bacteroidetes bacterium]|nr:hypothetical protein [Bacteroidota bacterium]